MFRNKKGDSNLISIVLIIGFTVGLGVLVWMLLRGVVIGNVEKISCDQEQITLDLAAECSCGTTAEGEVFNVKLINNGNVRIDGLAVITYDDQGVGHGDIPADLINCKPGNDCTVSYLTENCATNVKEVEVIPGVVKEAGEKAKLALCTEKLIRVSCI